MQPLLPGLAVACALAVVGAALGAWWPALGGISGALLVGVAVAHAAPGWLDAAPAPGLRLAEQRVLQVAIVGLGFGLDGGALLSVAGTALPVLAASIAVTVAAAVGLGPRLGMTPGLSLLVGVGQGICGTAAIAATAPVARAEHHELGVAMGVIHALGTVGVLALPAVALALGLDDDGAGLVIGGSLQSVGHAVAGGFAVSEAVGRSATMIKLARVALLPVVLVALAWRGGGGGLRAGLPPELVGFVGAATLATLGWVPERVAEALDTFTHLLLVVAMAAIGTRIRASDLRQTGMPAIGLGGLLFAAQVALLVVIARVRG